DAAVLGAHRRDRWIQSDALTNPAQFWRDGFAPSIRGTLTGGVVEREAERDRRYAVGHAGGAVLLSSERDAGRAVAAESIGGCRPAGCARRRDASRGSGDFDFGLQKALIFVDEHL